MSSVRRLLLGRAVDEQGVVLEGRLLRYDASAAAANARARAEAARSSEPLGSVGAGGEGGGARLGRRRWVRRGRAGAGGGLTLRRNDG